MLTTYRRLLALFDRRERFRFGLLIVLVIFMGFFELIGVASILPLLAVLANPDIIVENEIIYFIYTLFGELTVNQFLVLLCAGSFIFILFAQLFKMCTLYTLIRFSRMRGFSISSRLLRHYLSAPYEWFLGRNSADMGKSILSEVDGLVAQLIMPSLRFLAYVSVVIFLVAALVVTNPTAALVGALIVGGTYAIIFILSRRYLLKIGARRLAANNQRFRRVQETFGVIKDIKLMDNESVYLSNFSGPAAAFARCDANAEILSQLPRYMLELVLFGAILLFVLILLVIESGDIQNVLPTLGLYAFAGARLLPALQQTYRSAAMMRFKRPALESIYADLQEQPAERVAPRGGTALGLHSQLEFRDVRYNYPGAKRPALERLNVTIKANTSVGIVGATGAGKTTAVDILLGLLRPDSGALVVDGTVIDAGNLRAWQHTLGYVPQQIYLLDDTIAANIALGVRPSEIDMAQVERAARIARLHDFVRSELPEGYETSVGERGVRLSGGQRQRIGIARALYHDPAVLVLDEATSALDNMTEKMVMDAVQELTHAKTIIMIAHRLSSVDNCDKILMLEQGRCVAMGSYQELLRDCPSFRALATLAA